MGIRKGCNSKIIIVTVGVLLFFQTMHSANVYSDDCYLRALIREYVRLHGVLSAVLEEKLVSLLSSDVMGEIDEGLEVLKILDNPDQIVTIIEKVFTNKGLRLKIEGEGQVAITIKNLEDEELGRQPFVISEESGIVEFYSVMIKDTDFRGKRLGPMMFHWAAAHPYFRSRCSDWPVVSTAVNYNALRPFPEVILEI